MPELLGEDLEAVARDGKHRDSYLLSSNWRAARQFSGAMPRLDMTPPPPASHFSPLARERHWGPWTGERPLKGLLDPALSMHDEGVSWLLWLASQRPNLLHLSGLGAESGDGLSCLQVEDLRTGASASRPPHSSNGYWGVRVSHSGQTDQRDVWLDPEAFGRMARTIERTGGVEPERTTLALQVYENVGFDLFISADAALMKRRWRTVDCLGIVSVQEAQQMVQTLMRSRDLVLLRCEGGSTATTFHQHASDLATAMMPRTHRAMRSCLAPGNRRTRRKLADRLEAILSRQADLLRATQYLEELHYLEGHAGAGFDLLDHQLYNLQNAMVLASGSADILSQVLLDYSDRELARKDVSWLRLLDSGSDLRKELRSSSSPFVQTVTSHRHVDMLRLTYKLRDIYQHRHPLRAGIAIAVDAEGWHRWSKTCVSIERNIDETRWLEKRLYGANHTVDGLFVAGDGLYLIPHLYVRALAAALAELIDDVLEMGGWPDADWTNPSWSVIQAGDERRARAWP